MVASRSVNTIRHPRDSYIVIPVAVSGVATPENEVTHWRCHRKQGSRRKLPKSVLQAVLGRMQFILHATRRTPHGASISVQAMSAWLVKTRRGPSQHGRDARVYGLSTTAMHKLSTPPPSPCLFGNLRRARALNLQDRSHSTYSPPTLLNRRTPHGASRLMQAMSAWLVKIRRGPSRHSRDVRFYGHTTTAMHKLSTPPPH